MRLKEPTLCSKCKSRRPIIGRQYSGERLCKKCFIESIERKVKKTIMKYDMFDREDTIGVAVSGGKDSITLLRILSKMQRQFPRNRMIALTIDEGIKGYRKEALEISRTACKELGIEPVVSSFKEMYGYDLDEIVKVAQEKGGPSSCALCGMLRRRALNILARESGVTKLATAHNLDDEAQTILLNIMHGDVERLIRSKPKLDGIHPKFVQRVKPLYEIPEREIAFYAYLEGIRFQEAVCPYRETSMRQEAREVLGALKLHHPGIKYNIIRLLEKLRLKMREEPDVVIGNCVRCGEPSSQTLCKTCIELDELKAFLK